MCQLRDCRLSSVPCKFDTSETMRGKTTYYEGRFVPKGKLALTGRLENQTNDVSKLLFEAGFAVR